MVRGFGNICLDLQPNISRHSHPRRALQFERARFARVRESLDPPVSCCICVAWSRREQKGNGGKLRKPMLHGATRQPFRMPSKSLKRMVPDAVFSEPVSRPEFPSLREISGKICEFRAVWAKSPSVSLSDAYRNWRNSRRVLCGNFSLPDGITSCPTGNSTNRSLSEITGATGTEASKAKRYDIFATRKQ